MSKFKKIAAATTAALALGAAPALADNHEWVMEGNEFPDGNVYSITYGDGLFVTAEVRCTTECFKYSADGKTWEVGTHPTVALSYSHFKSVEYGDGNFVAVGGGQKFFYSEDGMEWKEANSPSHPWIFDLVTYNEEKDTWVAIGTSGYLTYSTDGGKNWSSPQEFSTGNSFKGVDNNGEAYVMAASYNPSPYRSEFVYLTHDDMLAGNQGTITYTGTATLGTAAWGYVNWNAATQKWVIVSGKYNGQTGIATSPDGINWNVVANRYLTGSWFGGVSVGDKVVHVGNATDYVMTVDPNDPGYPTVEDIPNNAKGMDWRDVAYGNGMYVAVAYGPTNSLGRTMRRGEVAELPQVPEDVLPENPVMPPTTEDPVSVVPNVPVYFPIAPLAPKTPTWDPNARGACERSKTRKDVFVKCVSAMNKLPDFTGLYTLKANLSGTSHKMKGACRWDGDEAECRVYLNRKGNWRLTWTAGDKTTARTVKVK